MKFLMIVLAVHFVAEIISRKRKETDRGNGDERNKDVRHPAEYDLR